jgi:hypothetical protein
MRRRAPTSAHRFTLYHDGFALQFVRGQIVEPDRCMDQAKLSAAARSRLGTQDDSGSPVTFPRWSD